ncbi:MAG: hypothetical protein EBZ48_12100, partial [Proteobacteria bacterium]|nr:hypothetical protein [Pseudomonadota bacterium]
MRAGQRSRLIDCSWFHRGATSVELALVLPIVLLLLFGAIEFSRYAAARSILESAVQNAASLASIIPGLDDEGGLLLLSNNEYAPGSTLQLCQSGPDASPCQNQEQALQAVIDKALDVAKSAGLTYQGDTGNLADTRITAYQVALPERGPEDPPLLVDRLLQKPIVVKVQGDFMSLIPGLPKIVISAEAPTYRDVRKAFTMPIDPMCGNNCPCPGRDYKWLLTASGCVCRSDLGLQMQDGDCKCLNLNHIPSPSGCVCPSPCTGGKLQNPNTCACSCPAGLQDNNGVCQCSN